MDIKKEFNPIKQRKYSNFFTEFFNIESRFPIHSGNTMKKEFGSCMLYSVLNAQASSYDNFKILNHSLYKVE